MPATPSPEDRLGLGPEWSQVLPRRDDGQSSAAAPNGAPRDARPDDADEAPLWDEPPPEEPPPFDEFEYADLDCSGPPEFAVPDRSGARGLNRSSDELFADVLEVASNPTSRKVNRCNVSPSRIDTVFSDVVAALHTRPAAEVSNAVGRLRAATSAWELMDPAQHKLWDGICEVLTFEVASLAGVGNVNFDYLPAKDSRRPQVAAKLDELKARNEAGDLCPNPSSVLDALVEDIAGDRFRTHATELMRLIEEGGTAAEKMAVYRKLSPPTFQRAEANKTWVKSASEWLDEARADVGGSADLIISSGLATLDLALSDPSNPGMIKPGEFWVVAAGTGHGKSAFARRAATAAAYDLRYGWGRRNSVVLYAFTEEEAPDVAKAMMLDRGQPFHYLADAVVLGKVGQSRVRLVEMFYDSVAAAVRKAQALGIPVSEAGLPDIMFVDYIQGIHEPGENPDVEGVANTADLLMRGIAAFDHEMVAQITGIDFRSYTGMEWPSGVSSHRVGVVVFSQLRKEANDHTVFYRKGKSSIADFAATDENGIPSWEPLEDDYAIPKRSDLRGSGVLLNHATGLLLLHRSKPQASIVKDPVTGKKRVSDTRARILTPKARKAVSLPYIPVTFDSNPEGYRGQFYDLNAEEHALQAGRMQFADCWQRSGDPLIPLRPKRSPFPRLRY